MSLPRPENQIWFVFNRLPGGQLTAQHVEDIVRNKKENDGTVKVTILAKDQVESIKKQKEVAIYIIDPLTKIGKLTKNEIIIYDGPGKEMLWNNPRAANVALDWARSKGAAPIPTKGSAKGDDPKTYQYNERIEKLENRIDEQDRKLDQILAAVGKK